ncbi:MAG: gliding motility-associated ABC transporter permease subunit GldF [Cyclobacteriaceae bacterium]|nr:gliding motility-associated ABC transporter permease subunit GldF [Cyclobacteriaceae bacterium HetDA_MAG_MS6]
MIEILKKEINEFLNSLIAYVVIGVFLTSIGLLMWVFPDTSVLDYGYASMEPLFSMGPYVFMFLVPAITMRSIAEEKKTGTIELLYTLPFTNLQIILGKYLAGFSLVVFSVLPTVVYYFSLSALGNPPDNLDTSGIVGSYIGLILLGGVFTSLGLLSSAVTENQIVSFVLASFLCFMFYAGFESLAAIDIWGDWAYYLEQFGILFHYNAMSRGLLDFGNLAYFLGVIAISLSLTHFTLAAKKW